MGIRHVVLFRFASEATDAQIDRFRAGLAELPSQVKGTEAYVHGPDAAINDGNFDYAIVADFADRAAYATYRDHPWHRQFIEERVKPIVADRAAVQYETGT